MQRLAHGGESRVEILGDDDVAEADDGDVTGAVEASVFNRADGAYGCGVVEAEDGGEAAGAGEQVVDRGIAELGRPDVLLKEDAEFGVNDDADLLCDADDGLPAGLGVEGVELAPSSWLSSCAVGEDVQHMATVVHLSLNCERIPRRQQTSVLGSLRIEITN